MGTDVLRKKGRTQPTVLQKVETSRVEISRAHQFLIHSSCTVQTAPCRHRLRALRDAGPSNDHPNPRPAHRTCPLISPARVRTNAAPLLIAAAARRSASALARLSASARTGSTKPPFASQTAEKTAAHQTAFCAGRSAEPISVKRDWFVVPACTILSSKMIPDAVSPHAHASIVNAAKCACACCGTPKFRKKRRDEPSTKDTHAPPNEVSNCVDATSNESTATRTGRNTK